MDDYFVSDDAVYMEDPKERDEYCVSDVGFVYRGSTKRISPKRWNFGQVKNKSFMPSFIENGVFQNLRSLVLTIIVLNFNMLICFFILYD